jgi:hypothetical protein
MIFLPIKFSGNHNQKIMRNTYKIAVAFTIMVIGLSACLKDKEYDDGIIQSSRSQGVQKIVEIGLTATNNQNFLSVNLIASNTDTTVALIPVRLASSQPAAEDIVVTLETSDALVTDYNTANGTNYLVPATSMYTILNNTVVIPKGAYEGYLQVRVKPMNYLGADYALGFVIKSVAQSGYTISGNLQNGVTALSIINRYDGVYAVTGTMNDLVNPDLTGQYPLTWELRTLSGSVSAVYDRGLSTQTHRIFNAGAPSQYGNFGLNITFDPVTNKITGIVNSYGQPSSNGRSAALDPTGVNAYDPVTRTIRIKYFMLQPGTTVRTTFNETWTYVRAR